MKKSCLLFVASVVLSLPGCAYLTHGAPEDRPDWVTDQALASVTKLGIDPSRDVVDKSSTRWRYRAKQKLRTASYVCPAGSSVDISPTSILIIAPKAAHCTGAGKTKQDFVRLSLDGSVEPLVVE